MSTPVGMLDLTMANRKQTKSEETRTRILESARRLFAECGYEGTTIREVGALAGIDPAMVMRYYGNKEKLFACAADFNLEIPDLTAIRPKQLGALLVEHFLRIWEEENGSRGLVILLRAAATNEDAVQRLQLILQKQLMPAIRSVTAERNTAVRAGLLATQMLGLAMTRYVLKLTPVVKMTREELICYLAPAVEHYVLGDLSAADQSIDEH